MNVGRFVGAVVVVWLVRSLLNMLYYGLAMGDHFAALTERHPGVFREVIPGFIATDLIFAVVLVYLWAKAGSAFGTGAKAGAIGGAWIGVLFGVIGGLYYYFSVTYMTVGLLAAEAVYQIVSVAIQGAVAAMIYKHPAPTSGAGAAPATV